MTICRLMIWDFTDSIGRYDEDGRAQYDDGDLRNGIEWAEWLLSDGYDIEPFLQIDLAAFRDWALQQLGDNSEIQHAIPRKRYRSRRRA